MYLELYCHWEINKIINYIITYAFKTSIVINVSDKIIVTTTSIIFCNRIIGLKRQREIIMWYFFVLLQKNHSSN